MKKLVLIAFAAMLLADTTKTVPFTAKQVETVQTMNQKAQSLAKEQQDLLRAIAAERTLLQYQYQKFIDDTCKEMKAQNCSANVTDSDPAKWVFTIPDPKPEDKSK